MAEQSKDRIGCKLGMAVKLMTGQLHEHPFEMVEVGFGFLVSNSELFPDFIIEIFQQLTPACGSWPR